MFRLVNQDRVYLRRWLPWVDPTETEDDSLSFIRSALGQFAAGESITAGIWLDDAFAGVIGTHKFNRLYRKVELGYWLGEAFQGKGIITGACRTMITHLFEDCGMNRVEICCAVGNTKSIGVPKRLGFQLEGTLREADFSGGQYHDLHVFGMVKREWPRMNTNEHESSGLHGG